MKFATGLELTAAEMPAQIPVDKRIDQAIAARPHKRQPLQQKPAKVWPKTHQEYSSRGSSRHRAADTRMVGSD